jgi:hypothetical protein
MISQTLIQEFRAKLGAANVFSEPADLLTYSYDAAPLEPVRPAPMSAAAWGAASIWSTTVSPPGSAG